MNSRTVFGILIAVFAAPIVAPAEEFPSRPITLVVSFAPGGLTDIPARMLAPDLQKLLGQPVVVVNKAGASGVTGGSYVVHSMPDGYTLLVSGISEVQNLFYINVPYSVQKDFAAIGKVADGPPLVLAVNAASPFKTVADLIAYAKANPSKTNLATTGPATSPAIAVSQLNSLADTKIVSVPYNGSGPAAAAVLSGEVQGGFVWLPSVAGMVTSGKVRLLAIARGKRLASLPDVPTMTESGYKDFEHEAFVGLLAPRGTPSMVIATLNKALNESIASPAFANKLVPFGMTVPTEPNTADAYERFIAKQTAYQSALSKLTGPMK